MIRIHSIATALLQVANVAKPELTSTILVALELGNGCISSLSGIKTYNTGTA